MLVLGLLLIVIALAALGIVIYDGAEKVSVEAFGTTGDTTVMGVFLAGVGITLLFFIGMWLLKSGNARSRKQRAERKAQRIRHRESVAKLEQERNELRAENERLAKAAGRPPVTASGQGAGTTPPASRHSAGIRTSAGSSAAPRSSASSERQPAGPRRHPARRSPSAGRPDSHGQARRCGAHPGHRPPTGPTVAPARALCAGRRQEPEQRTTRHLGKDAHLVLAQTTRHHATTLCRSDPRSRDAWRRCAGQQRIGRGQRRQVGDDRGAVPGDDRCALEQQH